MKCSKALIIAAALILAACLIAQDEKQKRPKLPGLGRVPGDFKPIPPKGPTAAAPLLINVALFSVKYEDHDDLASGDEPYIVHVGFKAKLVADATGKRKADPATLEVVTIGAAGHNNLGKTGDDWAKVGTRQRFSGQAYSASVKNEPGWIVGTVVAMYEEDMFSDTIARQFAMRLVGAVKAALSTMEITNLSDLQLNHTGIARFLREANVKLLGFFPNIFRGIASAVDPDDFAGANIVLTAVLPNNQVKMFAGPVSAQEKFLNMVDVPRPGGGNNAANFSLTFPAQDYSFYGFTQRGKYSGKCIFSGYVTRG